MVESITVLRNVAMHFPTTKKKKKGGGFNQIALAKQEISVLFPITVW